ncbi:hypothetical protein [Sphaerisporangium aureirubrum]|uniref:Uncharacterized protein n=1 Tax=Sphaerisporangium aureirubrum TaxID=1544736 RepID=A0ABW1NCP8_9ACTN
MALTMITPPVYSLTCDGEGCSAALRDDCDWTMRTKAKAAGWTVRPRRGKGSRSAPDLCSTHSNTGSGAAG